MRRLKDSETEKNAAEKEQYKLYCICDLRIHPRTGEPGFCALQYEGHRASYFWKNNDGTCYKDSEFLYVGVEDEYRIQNLNGYVFSLILGDVGPIHYVTWQPLF